MWKKLITVTLTLMLSVTFTGAVWAMEEGNKRKGKYIYRKVYQSCHERGAVETAPGRIRIGAGPWGSVIFWPPAMTEAGASTGPTTESTPS